MLRGVKKWLAIRSYAKGLGPQLCQRYGRKNRYTPAQVKQTIQECGYSTAWLCYAIAMFCDHRSFIKYHQETGESCDYNAMRSEVAERFFCGRNSFDATDVIDGGSAWDSPDAGVLDCSWTDGSDHSGGCDGDGID